MVAEELRRERDEIIARYGPWTAQNIHLGEGVYSMGFDQGLAAERNIQRTVQLVADLAGTALADLRILDLGAYECGFAIELASHGAHVTAVEVREQHVAKGEFAKRALGLENLTIVQGDVRALDSLVQDEFDVVLCLGLIYHLAAADAVQLLKDIAQRTRRFALIEGQVSLSRKERVEIDGVDYHGKRYVEDDRQPGAGVDMTHSFWFTRESLVRALRQAGFTTAAEVRLPFVPEIEAFRDHTTMLAIKGQPVDVRTVASPPGPLHSIAVPENGRPLAHPTQGWRYRLAEWVARRRGGGLTGVFRGPPDEPTS